MFDSLMRVLLLFWFLLGHLHHLTRIAVAKMVRPLFSIRLLRVGPHAAATADLVALLDPNRFSLADSGLQHDDVFGKDTMDISRFLRLSAPKSLHCLQRIHDGMKGKDGAYYPPQDTIGTKTVLMLASRFARVFHSTSETIVQRFESIGFVMTALLEMRAYIVDPANANVNLGTNFYSYQTFQHVMLGLAAAALRLKAHHDFCPSLAATLYRTGEQCLETFFSGAGGMGKIANWKRVYTVGELVLHARRENALKRVSSGKYGVTIPTKSKKREVRQEWLHANGNSLQPADLTDYPGDTDAMVAFNCGSDKAKTYLASVGCRTTVEGLWDKPYEYEKQEDKTMMRQEPDGDEIDFSGITAATVSSEPPISTNDDDVGSSSSSSASTTCAADSPVGASASAAGENNEEEEKDEDALGEDTAAHTNASGVASAAKNDVSGVGDDEGATETGDRLHSGLIINRTAWLSDLQISNAVSVLSLTTAPSLAADNFRFTWPLPVDTLAERLRAFVERSQGDQGQRSRFTWVLRDEDGSATNRVHNIIFGDGVHWKNVVLVARTRTIHIVDDMKHRADITVTSAGGDDLLAALLQASRAARGSWRVLHSSLLLQFDGFQCGVWKVYWSVLLSAFAASTSRNLLRFAAEYVSRDLGRDHELVADLLAGRTHEHRRALADLSRRKRQEYADVLFAAQRQDILPYEGEALSSAASPNLLKQQFEAKKKRESRQFSISNVGGAASFEEDDGTLSLVEKDRRGGNDGRVRRADVRKMGLAMELLDARRRSHSSTLTIPEGVPGTGRVISKATLVHELQMGDSNAREIPLERLKRVQVMARRASTAAARGGQDDIFLDGEMLSLGSDIALAFVDEGKSYRRWIGRVIKLISKSAGARSKRLQYLRPVALDSLPSELEIVCNFYEEIEMETGKKKKRKRQATAKRYRYNTVVDHQAYPVSCFLGVVDLKYIADDDLFELTATDDKRTDSTMNALDKDSAVAKANGKARRKAAESHGDDLHGAKPMQVARAVGKRAATKKTR